MSVRNAVTYSTHNESNCRIRVHAYEVPMFRGEVDCEEIPAQGDSSSHDRGGGDKMGSERNVRRKTADIMLMYLYAPPRGAKKKGFELRVVKVVECLQRKRKSM